MCCIEDSRQVTLGVIGSGRIAGKFVEQCEDVDRVEIAAVFNPRLFSAESFAIAHNIACAFDDLDTFFSKVDAVYIASPHFTHVAYIRSALQAGCHVLSEKPLATSPDEVHDVFALAKKKRLVLLEGIKTAFCPAFRTLEELVKDGRIGRVVDVDASFTKLMSDDAPEMSADGSGGSVLWLATYPLYAMVRFLGKQYKSVAFLTWRNKKGVDCFTRGVLAYEDASASFKVGFGAKTDGSLVITGTTGYVVVPAPWWNTSSFQVRHEDPDIVEETTFECSGSDLRYEVEEFVDMILSGRAESGRVTESDSMFIARIMEEYLKDDDGSCSMMYEVSL